MPRTIDPSDAKPSIPRATRRGQLLLGSFVVVAALAAAPQLSAQNHSAWKDYAGSADAAQFSSLTQINRSNVGKLKMAWAYRTGDNNRYSFSPVVVDNVAYVLARNNSIVAVEATTGKEIWVHDTAPTRGAITNRGINYWESKDRSERRLFYAANQILRAVDAPTGKLIPTFGANGGIDLRQGLGRDTSKLTRVQSMSPGRVFEDLLILGSATNQGYGSAPGDIRAFDVRSGRLVWTFHTIPRPGEFGYDTWPKDAWKTVGGANVWTEFSVDVERGIVYLPVASAKYNFYGADRAGANLFSDCLLALDARTGKRLWHYQLVHHDIWDYDNATAPKLLTVEHEGQKIDAVAQVTKQGFVFVFNRVTGEPLWPIEERPVPAATDMPRETLWPTQPFPVKPPPFARQSFTVDDLNPYLDPAERARYRDDILGARNEGLFTPPGRRNTIQMPGNNGGANWGGAAVNPTAGLLYVVSKDHPAMLKLDPDGEQRIPPPGEPVARGQYLYDVYCHSCHSLGTGDTRRAVSSLAGVGRKLSREQIAAAIQQGVGPMPAFAEISDEDVDLLVTYLNDPPKLSATGSALTPAGTAPAEGPASSGPPGSESDDWEGARFVSGFGLMRASNGLSPIGPPWSSLTAYDLNEGVIQWKIPLGEVPELAAKGIRNTGSVYPKVGPVVTASGLLFAGTRDKKVRAFDVDTGKILWEAQVAAALEGMPAVYEVHGKQYILFCASAQAGLTRETEETIQGAYVAFALPD
jgi:quinoprotein glucose dehydrogenase